jgi:REase_AHJR-like protein
MCQPILSDERGVRMTAAVAAEREFADALTKDFIEEGYERLTPSPADLPNGYMPDLMFRRGDEVVVIELKAREEHRDLGNLRQLKLAIERKPNWHFRLYVVPFRTAPEVLDDNPDIENLIETADRLNREEQFEAATVVLWMALETSLRVLLTSRQDRPNPGVSGVSMARRLQAEGGLDEPDVDLISVASQARNRAAHGYKLEPRKPLEPDLFDLVRRLAEKAKGVGDPAK